MSQDMYQMARAMVVGRTPWRTDPMTLKTSPVSQRATNMKESPSADCRLN